jgi:MFS transporter, putative metabolite:H+ symporter
VATLGVMGAVAAAIVGELVTRRTAYLIGGGLGLLLLVLRVHSAGILLTFSPELAKDLGVVGEVTSGRAVLAYYAATTFGDLSSGLLSQWLRSRRRAVAIYYALLAVGIVVYLSGAAKTPAAFYAVCAWLGVVTGFWAVMVTMAVEQFGTDLRATAATSVPTFVRASAVPMTLAFLALRQDLGSVVSAGIVGIVAMSLASLALWRQPETYGRDLDFVESDARSP